MNESVQDAFNESKITPGMNKELFARALKLLCAYHPASIRSLFHLYSTSQSSINLVNETQSNKSHMRKWFSGDVTIESAGFAVSVHFMRDLIELM